MIELTLDEARRIAVRAQLLDGSARDVLDTVQRLGYLQIDPTSAVAPTQRLVLWSRLGPYDAGELDRLLWEERSLFEWRSFIYAIEDLPLYRSRMRRFPAGDSAWSTRVRTWLAANQSFRRYVLRELRRRGPLYSRELDDRSTTAWWSGGWTANQNVRQMLEFLWARGQIALVGRQSGQRLYDLAERWYPPGETVPAREAERVFAERRLRSLGIARSGPGLPARVEGVSGRWVVHPDLVDSSRPLPKRATLLSPFDRLIYDRERTEDLFGMRFRLEIYVPKAKREYGYFVMPVLDRDRLVGRVDPQFDRKTRVLRVHAVHSEADGDLSGLPGALESLAAFLGAESVEMPRA
jgi:uncharacterized protein YcaQ